VNRQSLISAIQKSLGTDVAPEEVVDLWTKVDFLYESGRYARLLSQLATANDKSNFLALILELNFAHQFESRGLEVTYEVNQDEHPNSSIDFLRVIPDGERVYFELRLLQQAEHITRAINDQLESDLANKVALSARNEQDDVLRIQSNILSKVQDKQGKPIKFFSTAHHTFNIVVVDIADCILGMMDIHDCMLACQGDPGVEEPYQRGVFGLFQPDMPHFPQSTHDIAKRYAHIRGTIHGILFLDRVGEKIMTYRLCHYLVWNPALIDEPTARRILADVSTAIPAHPSLSNYEYE
jgi:hypothetical protein